MKHSGYADLPLHGGKVPYWLARRMAELGGAIVSTIVEEYGRSAFLSKLSDPLWFQSLGCVLGMDWHSSGITTSVMGALKKSVNQMSDDLGIYICGGRGKHSLKTPNELIAIADKVGFSGGAMVYNSKLSAKIDNTALQDGYQLYLHSFIVTKEGEWSVVQQGMNGVNKMARRYHWHSPTVKSFVDDPQAAVCGINNGDIINLSTAAAKTTRSGILNVSTMPSSTLMKEKRSIVMPRHHDVRAKDVDLKRLGSVLAVANNSEMKSFEDLLLIKGMGPRTLQSLTLVSEIIHGTPSRFTDPARFSFAHGGKDGHPFPVPTKVYDQTIDVMKGCVDKAKIDYSEKKRAIASLHIMAQQIEKNFQPQPERFNKIVQKERNDSYKYGGRTVAGKARPLNGQLDLFL